MLKEESRDAGQGEKVPEVFVFSLGDYRSACKKGTYPKGDLGADLIL